MAKLNGVTVVSEKITYNGAEYVKTDAAAKVGDIVRCDDSGYVDMENGDFFVIESGEDGWFFRDNGNDKRDFEDNYGYEVNPEEFTVFAKVEAVTKPAEDNAEYGKVKAKVGERIRITKAWGADGKYANGDVFVVTKVREDGVVYVAEHDRPIAQNEYDVITSALPSDYVIHEGAVYRKESRKAAVGELAVTIANRHHGWPSGVIVKCEEHRYFRSETETTLNGCGGQRTQYLDPHEYAVLVPTDTVTIGGAEYTLEKRKANVGDTVLVVAAEQAAGNYANGTISTIESESCGEPAINGRFLYRREYFVLVPKASAKPTPNYREVKRKANVGERIRIVAAEQTAGLYANGDILTVTDAKRWAHSDDAISVKEFDRAVYHREYVVLEEAKPAPANRLKVGDYAKVTKKCFEYKAGDIVKVAEKQSNGCFDFRVERVGDDGTHYADESFLVRATDAEVAAAKRKNVKVGDYVRITVDESGDRVGTVVKVKEISDDGDTSNTTPLDGRD